MPNLLERGFVWLLFERNTKNKSYVDYKQAFEVSAQHVSSLIDRAIENEKSRAELRHMIGMERWMQSRMKVALGEPFVMEEHNRYKPAKDAAWDDLKQDFIDMRQVSCDLCDEFAAKNTDGTQKILHNQFGNSASKHGWNIYSDIVVMLNE